VKAALKSIWWQPMLNPRASSTGGMEQGAGEMADRSERRQAQRVDATLKLEVQVPVDGGQAPACLETLNISTAGIYFRADHYIEPMTKLEMLLELPVPGADGAVAGDLAAVPCEGIVVRITPEDEQPGCDNYEVAVFFTNIEPESMSHLEEHIAMLITAG